MATRRFPPPWSVEEQPACFIVRDRDGQQLAYVYYESEPGRRSAAKLLSKDEARRIDANKLVYLRKPESGSAANCARLLPATAIECTAVVSGVTVVPNARIAGVTLTGLHGYKAVAAMGKPLELDGGERALRK